MAIRPVLLAAVLPLVLGGSAARAQDFMFGSPSAQLTLRAGSVLHRAHSDVFDFITSELTIDHFRAPSLGAELSVQVHPRLDVMLGVARAETERQSEFRDWVDQDDLPIEQTTTLRTTPLALSVRYYPTARGTAISKLAWVPARFTPYLGGGIGMTWYRLHMQGDFIDLEDENRPVFSDDYESDGSGMTAHVLAGADYWFAARAGLNVDARYTFGSAALGKDFRDWDKLDLSGLQAGLGLTFRW